MMQTLFVYYKVPLEQRAVWCARVAAFRQRVAQDWPGLQLDLMQRPQASADGLETWMEIYRHPEGLPDALGPSLDRLAAEMGMPPRRAAELFVPLRG